MSKKANLIDVEISSDDRGELTFSNTFDFNKNKIRRFYKIMNHNINFIRAWHGHKVEEKFILILNGSLKISLVKVDNWKEPSKKLKLENFYLNEKKPQILHIPAGFAHGTQNLTRNTSFIVFSTLPLNESLKDDFRFPYNYWGEWKISFR